VKVAVVGVGYYGPRHVAAWQQLPQAQLCAIVDADAQRAQAAADAAGVRAFTAVGEMLAQARPDVVDLVTPETGRLALVEQLAGAVPVLVSQKPLAPTFDEASRIVQVARGRGTQLYVHENFRLQPWFLRVREHLDAGTLGPPQHLLFRFRPGDGRGPDAYLARQPYFRSAQRFLVHETGIHYIDTFRALLGEVTAVTARLRRVNPVLQGEDAGLVLFDFASGATAVLDANRDLDHAADDARLTRGELLLECRDGSLRLDGHGRLWRRTRGDAQERLDWTVPEGAPVDGVLEFQRRILGALDGKPKAAAYAEAGAWLRNAAIEEAIYRSAVERRTVATG
jgi:predicted dehydrogenase